MVLEGNRQDTRQEPYEGIKQGGVPAGVLTEVLAGTLRPSRDIMPDAFSFKVLRHDLIYRVPMNYTKRKSRRVLCVMGLRFS